MTPSTFSTFPGTPVEFRELVAGSLVVVKVWPGKDNASTRIVGQSESFRPNHIVEPISLSLGEITEFISLAFASQREQDQRRKDGNK